MKRREIQASIGQRLLWLLHEYHGQSGAMNCPLVCRLEGPVDASVLGAALDYLVSRHESLRTTFVRRGRQLRQVIHEPRAVAVGHVDLSGVQDPDSAVREALGEELRTSIDPTQWPLRTTLWRLGKEAYVLCLNMHHLVIDTWSCGVLQRELVAAYAQGQAGLPRLPFAGWQFSQFMAWQERQLAGEGFRGHREYWRRQLEGARAPRLTLGEGRPGAGRTLASVHAKIDAATAEGLRRIAAAHRTTFFAVVLACFYTLLYRLTGQQDMSVASLFANRTRPEVSTTVGFLANLLVLPVRLRDVANFADVLQHVWDIVRCALAHQEVPFHIVSQGPSTAGLPRLDEVVFQVLVEPIDQEFHAGPVTVRGMVPEVVGRFDFELALMPAREGVAVKLDYTEQRVSPDYANAFIASYVAVTQAVVKGLHLPLEQLPVCVFDGKKT
jgi:hypothetical protein